MGEMGAEGFPAGARSRAAAAGDNGIRVQCSTEMLGAAVPAGDTLLQLGGRRQYRTYK